MKKLFWAIIVLLMIAINGIALGQSLDFVGSVSTPAGANAVVVSGNYAYIANGNFGLQIIDVADPVNPVITGNYDTPGQASDVFVSGQYAYVADYSSLQIINITNPANPTLTGSFAVSRECFGVFVVNNYAYLAIGYPGLRSINISNPAHPVAVGQISVLGGAQDLVIQNNYAYVIGNISEPYCAFLTVVEISNPSYMHPVGYSNPMSGLWALDIKVAGNYLYVANSNGGLQNFEISDPANPFRLECNISYGVNGVFIDGYHAFTADGYAGIHLTNILHPGHFKPLCGNDTGGNAQGICYADSLIYVADNTSLRIFHLNRQCRYIIGDINESGRFDGFDIVFFMRHFWDLSSYIYACECPPPEAWYVAGDINGSCTFNGLDVTYAMNYFKGGVEPRSCGVCPPAGTSDR